jgi:ABC-type dipeptide/oligopeptide/nickel transport system ATPase component
MLETLQQEYIRTARAKGLRWRRIVGLHVLRDSLIPAVTGRHHDLGVVAGMCERINVMYCGLFMETGSATQLFTRPRHPYTVDLLQSIPRLDAARRSTSRSRHRSSICSSSSRPSSR